MCVLWLASLFSHFSHSSLHFLFFLSPGHAFLAFLPCPFVCEILLQAMINYCQMIDYLQVDIDENKVVEFELYTVVVVP